MLELDAVQVAVGEVGIDMRVLNPASRPAVGPIVVTNVLPTGAQVVGDPTGPWSCSGEPLRCIADQQQIAAHGATGRLSLKARIPGSKRTVTVRWVPVVRTAHGAVPAQPVVLQVAERAPEDVGPIARIDGFFEPDGRPRAGAASTATLEVVNEGETTIHAVTARLRPVHGARVLRASGTGWTCTGTTCSFAGTLTRGDVAAPLSVEYRAPRSATGARSLVAAVVRATRTRGYAMLSADVAPPLALSATAEPSSLVEEAVKASRVVDLTALGDGGTDTALSYRWSQVCPRVGCPVTARWQTPRTDPVARVLIPEHEGDVTLTFRVVADDGSAKSAHTVRVRSIGDLGASGQNVARTAIGTRGADIGTRFSSWGTTDVSIGILDGKRIRASGPYWRTEYDGTWHLRGMAGPTFDGSLDCFGDSCQGTLEGDGALPVLASLGLTAHTTLEVQDDTVAFASYIDPPTRGGAPAAVLEGTIDASGAVHAELTAVIPLGSARLSFSRAPLVRDRSGRIVKAPVGALTAPTTLGALALDSASARWEADAIHLTGQARPLVGPIAGQAAGAITGAVRSPSDWNVDLARRPLASPFDIGGVSVTDLGVTSRSASTGYAYDLHGRLHNAPSSPSAGLVLDTAEATSPGLCAPGCALHGAAQARIRGRLVLRPRSAAHGGDLTAPVELHGAIAAGAPHRFATAPFSLPLATGLSLDGAVLALDVADGTTAASMTGRLASASGQLGGATTATFTPEGFHLATPLGDWTPPGQLAGSAVVVRGASLLISASPSPVKIVSPAGESTLPAYGGLLVGTLGLPAWALAIAPAAEGTALAAPLALDPALVFAGPVAVGAGRTLVGSETSASSVAAGAVYF
ncbi:MAG: hypothetical protein ACR2JV_02055, partial [Gaiellales bacterium]